MSAPIGERLGTLQPDATWTPAGLEAEIEAIGAEPYRFRIWGGDWCPDCRRQLPAFAAALRAAAVPDERTDVYPVEREDGGKVGPEMERYGVERIPTVIVERDGEERARFVEDADAPIVVELARQLSG